MNTRVAICIITFNRPNGLRTALDSLSKLKFNDERPQVTVVVVDNDPVGSAKSVCDEIRELTDTNVIYEIETQRGIPFARNHAVRTALKHGDLICFIDDDEWVDPDWLEKMLRGQQRFGADVITGPVLSLYDGPADEWADLKPFFDYPHRETGTLINRAYTNNVMVRAEVYRDMDELFDERLALTGGSDAHFFRKVAARGYRIVWADDIAVSEYVPASRANPSWIYQRAYRIGLMSSFIEYDLAPRLATKIKSFLLGAFRIGKGVLFSPLMLVNRRYRITYVRHLYYGAGMIAGLFGQLYDEYDETHGS